MDVHGEKSKFKKTFSEFIVFNMFSFFSLSKFTLFFFKLFSLFLISFFLFVNKTKRPFEASKKATKSALEYLLTKIKEMKNTVEIG